MCPSCVQPHLLEYTSVFFQTLGGGRGAAAQDQEKSQHFPYFFISPSLLFPNTKQDPLNLLGRHRMPYSLAAGGCPERGPWHQRARASRCWGQARQRGRSQDTYSRASFA